MPLADNLLPEQGESPWYDKFVAAWNAMRTFVNNLETLIAGKANTSHTHTTSQVTGLDSALSGKSDTGHTHTTAQVTGLDTALVGKAASTHTHTTAQVTGLDTALAGKAASTHTHTVAQLSDATTLGRDLAKASNATVARSVIGAGTPIAVYDNLAALEAAMPASSTPAGTIAATRG